MGDDPTSRRREATAWFARLRSRAVTNAELGEFASWRKDPANAEAYRHAEQMWEDAGRLRGDDAVRSEVAALQAGRIRPRAGRRQAVLIVGALVAVGAGLATLERGSPGQDFRTSVGERSEARLDDGSLVQLDADTSLAANFDDDSRDVTLDRGEAFFRVRHDAARPFTVRSGGVTITALGTSFDVAQTSDRVTVTLMEGSVAVQVVRTGKSVVLSPGEMVSVVAGRLGETQSGIADERTAWRSGRLVLRNTALAEAIDRMNRYTDLPIYISKPAMRDEPLSGDFSTTDAEGFVAAVNGLLGAGTVRRDVAPVKDAEP